MYQFCQHKSRGKTIYIIEYIYRNTYSVYIDCYRGCWVFGWFFFVESNVDPILRIVLRMGAPVHWTQLTWLFNILGVSYTLFVLYITLYIYYIISNIDVSLFVWGEPKSLCGYILLYIYSIYRDDIHILLYMICVYIYATIYMIVYIRYIYKFDNIIVKGRRSHHLLRLPYIFLY